jgi:DNA (cytosine-5)-methyltransferase 1
MSVQLQMFGDQSSRRIDLITFGSPCQDFSLGRKTYLGWKDTEEVLLSSKQLGSFTSADLVYLCGKMLKEHSPQTMAQIFGQSSKPLPTLGVIDLNGNCLTHRWFLPQNRERIYLVGYSTSTGNEIGEEFFLSEKVQNYLIARSGTKDKNQQVCKMRIISQEP